MAEEMTNEDIFESLIRGMAADLNVQVGLTNKRFAELLRDIADRLENDL